MPLPYAALAGMSVTRPTLLSLAYPRRDQHLDEYGKPEHGTDRGSLLPHRGITISARTLPAANRPNAHGATAPH